MPVSFFQGYLKDTSSDMLILLKTLGDYCIGEPPLTIPNREVKPNCADGTAYCGRVGRRLSYLIPSATSGWDFFIIGFFRTIQLNIPFPLNNLFVSKEVNKK